jgi:hypothetical protein
VRDERDLSYSGSAKVMSPIGHLQYGWWFAHWSDFTRGERAAIALAGAAPDLDGLSLLGGQDVYYAYHHILFHNVGAAAAVLLLGGIFWWKKKIVWMLVTFSFAMHIVEDYVTTSWNQHPWKPLSDATVNLSKYLPGWMVQGVFQATAMIFILGVTIWIYIRRNRTPLEILSPALDRLLVNYAVLPFRHACAECGRRAHFRCDTCGRAFCSAHGRVASRFRATCAKCLPSAS